MKPQNHFLVIAFTASVFFMLNFQRTNSSITQPAAGNNGAPNTIPAFQTCGHCHSGGASKNITTTNLEFTFNDGTNTVPVANLQYELNKQYTVIFKPLTTSKRYGFQISALTSANANGGTLALNEPIHTHTSLVPTPTTYLSHYAASSYRNWSFSWTAPATNVGNITFYYVFNASDSSGTDTGDTIYIGNSVVHPSVTAIQNINAVSNLSVYPNPASAALNVSFDMEQAENVQLDLFSLEGKLMKTFFAGENVSHFNSTFNVEELPAGIYLLQIKTGEKLSCRKIVVQ